MGTNKTIKGSPEDPASLERLLEAIRDGAWPIAHQHAKQRVVLQPDDAFLWKALGLILHFSGDYQMGRTCLAHSHYLNPADIEACINLGILYQHAGSLEAARRHFQKALQIDLYSASAHSNLAAALMELKEWVAAERHSRLAITLQPGFHEAFSNLGKVLHQQARYCCATAAHQKAVCLSPQLIGPRNDLAMSLMEAERPERSQSVLMSLLTLDPAHADALNNLSVIYQRLGWYEKGVITLRHAITLRSDHAAAWNNLASLHAEKNGHLEAAIAARHALALDPNLTEAYTNYGNALHGMKHPESARLALQRAIAICPVHANAYSNLAVVLFKDGEKPGAETCAKKALCLNPSHANTWSNLAVMMRSPSLISAARTFANRAIVVDPDSVDAQNNLGVVLHEEGSYREAIEAYTAAIRRNPELAMAHCNRGQTLLLLGQLRDGWRDYEWRYQDHSTGVLPRKPPERQWHPEHGFTHRTLLLHSEQGLGDTLQFCRYASRVADLGSEVVLEVQPPLKSLITTMDSRLRVIASDEGVPHYDRHCSLLTMAGYFESQGEAPPMQCGYLHPAFARLQALRGILGERSRQRIGLCMSGHPAHPRDAVRSIPLPLLASLIMDNFDFYLIQKDSAMDAATGLSPFINLKIPAIQDFEDTAALIQLMDLVISVDTSVAHLAGALNVPVWLLLPSVPDWRWLAKGDRTRWYASMQLFRKKPGEGWDSLLSDVRRRLLKTSHFRFAPLPGPKTK